MKKIKYDKSNPFHVNQVRIAKQTLLMPDEIAAYLGYFDSMTKEKAKQVLDSFGIKYNEE